LDEKENYLDKLIYEYRQKRTFVTSMNADEIKEKIKEIKGRNLPNNLKEKLIFDM